MSGKQKPLYQFSLVYLQISLDLGHSLFNAMGTHKETKII